MEDNVPPRLRARLSGRGAGTRDSFLAGRGPCCPPRAGGRDRGFADGAELARFHRVQGTAGYAAAADYVRQKALAAGLSNVAIESFPADGVTRYAHFRSYPGWQATSATLEEVSPQKRPIAAYPELAVALADYSQEADVTAELVEVGKGIDAKAYAGKDVRGKLVLADGSLPAVHQAACVERGAAGIVSAAANQVTAWSGDDRDLIRWGHLDPYQPNNRFAFMVSKRQAEEFRARLSRGEQVRLHAVVRARMAPGTYDVVVATIPGSDPAAGEVVVTAHLCHESAGANDNASGSAAILEVARGLARAIGLQRLTRPRRTIRFLWLPGNQRLPGVPHPAPRARPPDGGGVHMDMVGGLSRPPMEPSTCRAPWRHCRMRPMKSPGPGSTTWCAPLPATRSTEAAATTG